MIFNNLSGGQHVINRRRKPVVLRQHKATARRAAPYPFNKTINIPEKKVKLINASFSHYASY